MLTTKFWKKYFEEYDILNVLHPYQDILENLVNSVDVKPGDKIFDAGSGTGNLAIKLEKKGANVVGLDSSIEGIEIHKRKIPHATVVHGDLIKPLPFADAIFDKICSNNTIYTLPKESHEVVFREFFRVLKSGGRISISNPKIGFSPLTIYLDHVKSSFKRVGIIKTVLMIFELIVPTVKIFYYNILINRENRMGNYSFFGSGEQGKLLSRAGFVNVSPDVLTYANQAIMNSADKPK